MIKKEYFFQEYRRYFDNKLSEEEKGETSDSFKRAGVQLHGNYSILMDLWEYYARCWYY